MGVEGKPEKCRVKKVQVKGNAATVSGSSPAGEINNLDLDRASMVPFALDLHDVKTRQIASCLVDYICWNHLCSTILPLSM